MERTFGCRKLFASFALALIILNLPAGSAGTAYASAPAEYGERTTRHFSVPEPATKQDAVKLLNDSLAKIEQALASGDFSAIHEASYSVEVALERIGREPGYDGVKALVSPRCEIVHLASEMQDGETLKAAVPSLAKAVREQLLAK